MSEERLPSGSLSSIVSEPLVLEIPLVGLAPKRGRQVLWEHCSAIKASLSSNAFLRHFRDSYSLEIKNIKDTCLSYVGFVK